MVAIVEPVPPPELVGVHRQQVLNFLVQTMHIPVLSAETWFQGVGLFEMSDPVVRGSFTMHPPFPLGLDEDGNEFLYDSYHTTRGRVSKLCMVIDKDG